MAGRLLAGAIGTVLAAGLAYGQRGPAPVRPAAQVRKAPAARTPLNDIDRWNRMSAEQREKALAKLPPERRRAIRERLDQFNSLPKEEQQRLRERYDRFSKLPPKTQELVRTQLRNFNEVPPDRRRVLVREIQRLRRLPDGDRRRRMQSRDFRASYAEEERLMLQVLSETFPITQK